MGKQNNECGYSNNLFIYHRFIIYKGQYPVVDVFVLPTATYIYLSCPPYQCGVLSIMGGDVANPDPGTNVLLISVNNIYFNYIYPPVLQPYYNCLLVPLVQSHGPQWVLLHQNIKNMACFHLVQHYIIPKSNLLVDKQHPLLIQGLTNPWLYPYSTL